MSPCVPHCRIIGTLGLLLGMTYHTPFEGRQTAKSVFPSPPLVPRHRDISLNSPLLNDWRARIAAGNDVPHSTRCAPDSYVCLLITIVVPRHRNVSLRAPPPEYRNARIAAGDDVPHSIRGPKHRKVR